MANWSLEQHAARHISYHVSKSVLSKDAGQCNEARGVARNVCCCDVLLLIISLCPHDLLLFPISPKDVTYYLLHGVE